MDDLVKRARDCANGIGDFKSDKGDFGLLDELADRIEALERQIAAADKLAGACESAFDGIDATGPQEFYVALTAYQATKEQSDA